ncbi:MAG TPA: ATP-binding protein [Clostridiales bacterium]|jgi:anti-sigma regulatory factor (Ser/Thr protein kinase)|nr:ATP-binding protein [Clostridiales bacterium]
MKELSLNILDIAQNSIKASASRVEITLEKRNNWLTITISDDGTGMSPAFAAEAANPFTTTRTTRKVGMGLPLFKMAAEQTGGTFSIESHQAANEGDTHGTTVTAAFDTAHVDCAPMGDITESILTLIQGNPDLSLTYVYQTEAGEQRLSTDEMREVLGDEVPLNSPDVLAWAREFLNGES